MVHKMSDQGRAVIDAEGLILGRMASLIAKRLLEGERIEIVNAENAVVSGKRLQIINARKDFLNIGGRNRKGPIHYRRPNDIRELKTTRLPTTTSDALSSSCDISSVLSLSLTTSK